MTNNMRIILAENHRWDRHSVRGIIEPTLGNQEPLTSFTCIPQSSTVLENSLMPKPHHSPARTPGYPTAQNTLIRPSCYSGSFISHPLIQSLVIACVFKFESHIILDINAFADFHIVDRPKNKNNDKFNNFFFLFSKLLFVYFISVPCQSFPDGNPIYFFTRK